MRNLTDAQAEELRHICRESAVASVRAAAEHGRYSYAFVRPRRPIIAARLYMNGLMLRTREAERESGSSPWRYFWVYKPTAAGIDAAQGIEAATAAETAQTGSVHESPVPKECAQSQEPTP